jgi:hypothetical protein
LPIVVSFTGLTKFFASLVLFIYKAEEIQRLLQQLNTVNWPKEAEKQLESFIISTISLGAPEITASGFFKIRRPLCTAVSVRK